MDTLFAHLYFVGGEMELMDLPTTSGLGATGKLIPRNSIK